MDRLTIIKNLVGTQSNIISSSTQNISAFLQGGETVTQEIIQLEKKYRDRRQPRQGGSRKGQAPNLWQDFESGYR
jgi:hypothetical protein